jgi:hypothetical protein
VMPGHVRIGPALLRLVTEIAPPIDHLLGRAAADPKLQTPARDEVRRTGVLAKQAAGIDALSGGRLVLGVSIGARREDYEAAGAADAWPGRGKRLSDQLAELRELGCDLAQGYFFSSPQPPEVIEELLGQDLRW